MNRSEPPKWVALGPRPLCRAQLTPCCRNYRENKSGLRFWDMEYIYVARLETLVSRPCPFPTVPSHLEGNHRKVEWHIKIFRWALDLRAGILCPSTFKLLPAPLLTAACCCWYSRFKVSTVVTHKPTSFKIFHSLYPVLRRVKRLLVIIIIIIIIFISGYQKGHKSPLNWPP